MATVRTRSGLSKEEGLGLGVALALHAGLLVLLRAQPGEPPVIPPPQRIEVTLSDDVGLTSTSPNPFEQAAPDIAPTLGEAVPAPAPEPAPAPQPVPAPVPKPAPPQPAPKPVPAPRPVPKPVPKPAPKPALVPPKPAPKPAPKPVSPAPKPVPKSAAKPATRTPPHKSPIDQILSGTERSANVASKPATQPKKAGGSRVGSDFLSGVAGATANQGKGTPAAAVGPQVRSALSGAITRQLKPHWNPPDGADADQLVTILSFNLNPDGSLAGRPTVVRQMGITDANRAQAQRHAEQAIRAVQLASPFNLPSEYYDAWKRVSSFRFDLRLSQ